MSGPIYTEDWRNETIPPPPSASDGRMPSLTTRRVDGPSPCVAYLVLGDGLPRSFTPEQHARAHEYARNTGGIVAAVREWRGAR